MHIKQSLDEYQYDIEIYQDRGLRVTPTEALINLDIIRKPISIVVLLYIQNVQRYYIIITQIISGLLSLTSFTLYLCVSFKYLACLPLPNG